MNPWWIINYFGKSNKYSKYDSTMIPFKLLPELADLDVRRGHRFKTDQFEIEIPGADIKLHMPSMSLWVQGQPHPVKDASRVILFNRNYHRSDGRTWKEVCIGLLSVYGNGLMVRYRMDTKECTIINIEGGMEDPKVVLSEPPPLPEMGNK
jgi:hypothetical protein